MDSSWHSNDGWDSFFINKPNNEIDQKEKIGDDDAKVGILLALLSETRMRLIFEKTVEIPLLRIKSILSDQDFLDFIIFDGNLNAIANDLANSISNAFIGANDLPEDAKRKNEQTKKIYFYYEQIEYVKGEIFNEFVSGIYPNKNSILDCVIDRFVSINKDKLLYKKFNHHNSFFILLTLFLIYYEIISEIDTEIEENINKWVRIAYKNEYNKYLIKDVILKEDQMRTVLKNYSLFIENKLVLPFDNIEYKPIDPFCFICFSYIKNSVKIKCFLCDTSFHYQCFFFVC